MQSSQHLIRRRTRRGAFVFCFLFGFALFQGIVFAQEAAPTESADGAAAAEEEEAPYLKKREPIKIFDPAKGEELTPIQRAAERQSIQEKQAERRTLTQIENLLTYEYVLTGASEERILSEARVRALVAAAGRVYFENCFLLGRDLLQPYLTANGQPFVARTSVLDRRVMGKDKMQMRVRLSVNQDRLYEDLREKKFVAEPNLRPIVAVRLKEILHGQDDPSAEARRRLETTLQDNQFRVFSKNMKNPPLTTDISLDADLFKMARDEAQRHDVDILFTGTVQVKPLREGEILYDNYAFNEASVALKMYRVDTGELLGEVNDRYSASGANDADATAKALDALMERVARGLAVQLTELWGHTMLDTGQFHLLIGSVTPDELVSVRNLLSTISPELKIYQKSYYGEVAVLNVVLPDFPPDQLEAFLRKANEPQFSVKRVGKRQFELEVL
jgi:hypothetical protein